MPAEEWGALLGIEAYNLGLAYFEGRVVNQNFAEACDFFSKAKEQGHVGALYMLGICKSRGLGVTQDLRAAATCFYGASSRGNSFALSALGFCHWVNDAGEFSANPAEVGRMVELLRQAAAHRINLEEKKEADVEALTDQLSEAATFYNLAKEQFEQKNYTESAQLLRKAGDMGNLEALLSLAQLMELGLGIEKNSEESVQLLREAASKGLPEAIFGLAQYYENGIHVPKDESKAAELYKQAADLGHLDALFNLALCFRFGRGVTKNNSEALRLYKQAAYAGIKEQRITIPCSRKKWLLLCSLQKCLQYPKELQ